eukprot:6046300-Pyramimonas_sp.AAC.2
MKSSSGRSGRFPTLEPWMDLVSSTGDGNPCLRYPGYAYPVLGQSYSYCVWWWCWWWGAFPWFRDRLGD